MNTESPDHSNTTDDAAPYQIGQPRRGKSAVARSVINEAANLAEYRLIYPAEDGRVYSAWITQDTPTADGVTIEYIDTEGRKVTKVVSPSTFAVVLPPEEDRRTLDPELRENLGMLSLGNLATGDSMYLVDEVHSPSEPDTEAKARQGKDDREKLLGILFKNVPAHHLDDELEDAAEDAIAAGFSTAAAASRVELLEELLAEAEAEVARASQDEIREHAATALFLRERLRQARAAGEGVKGRG